MSTLLKQLFMGLICVCISSVAIAQDEPTLTSGSSGDVAVTVQITGNGNFALRGTMANVNELSMKTKFGQATIPLTEINGVKLHADEKGSCVVAFKNGDIVTGQLDLEKISITTNWGDANIRVDNIEMILTNPKGSFFKDTAAGKTYWRFSETRPVANPRLSGTNSNRQARPNVQTRPANVPRTRNVGNPNFNGGR